MSTYLEKLAAIWAELGINQKVSVILASFLLLGGTIGVILWSKRSHMQLLYGRLEGNDVSEVLAVLESKGVPYEMGAGGSSILVPGDHVHELRMELATKGVPSSGSVGYEIFDKGNFGISDFVQRTNYIRAVQGELGRTISKLRSVKSARVMVVMPENRLIAQRNHSHPTASVFVDTGITELSDEAINSIRFLVANSVENLKIDSVAVVDNRGKVLSEQVRYDETLGHANGQLKLRKEIESYFSTKIETLLARAVGTDNVVAQVSVDLDPETLTRMEESFDPEGQVVRSQSISENTSTAAELNKTTQENPDGEASNKTQEAQKNKNVSYEINRSTSEMVRAPGTIKQLSASVFVAMRYEGEGEEAKEKPRSAAELESFKKMVIHAIGLDAETADANISLQEVSFFKEAQADAALGADIASKAINWFDFIRQFLPIGIALFFFMTFMRMLKNYRPSHFSMQAVEAIRKEVTTPEKTEGLTPEILNRLIKEKPENISLALKNWTSSQN